MLLSLALPAANTHMFDLGFMPRYKLWRYNNRFTYYSRDSMNAKILKHKIEKPALFDSHLVDRSSTLMKQYMENLGYFYADVQYSVQPVSKRSVFVNYTIHAGKNYTIGRLNYQSPDEPLRLILEANRSESMLLPGEAYTKIKCGLERDRLYKIIRNQGYFDFKADNIHFSIDTSDKERISGLLNDPFSQALNYKPNTEHNSLDVKVQIRPSRDSNYALAYHIQDVKVDIISPDDELLPMPQKTESDLDDVHFSYVTLPVNRKVITRNIFIHQGDLFNTRDFEITVNRLNQLGVFQFVNIRYEKVEGKTGELRCLITLHTAPRFDLVGVTDLSTSDDDYLLGTGLGITFRNRNLFHGANNGSFRASYSTEFRNDEFLTGNRTFYQSGNNVNLNLNLTFPKFIVPFNQNVFSKKNMPYTQLGATYSFIRRIQNYTLINISGNFGYSWQETQRKNWHVYPVFLTVTQVPEKFLGATFKEKLLTNEFLRKTFSNHVIQGENMLFEYRKQGKGRNSNLQSLKLGLEEAGTVLKGVNWLYNKFSRDSISAIANYIKMEGDYRYYLNRNKSQWVNRLMLGIGIPMRDSKTLPYIKQFSAGGPFSNRGWRSRSLGPGRVVDTTYQSGFVILDQTGDLKLEMNSEYRFNLLKLFSGAINLKGAAFIDAGNIWLLHPDEHVQGAEFDTRYLWQDIAISGGLGLRFDFSFFVFRVDLGYPVKQPQIQKNNGFVFDSLHPGSGLWNIALGYPF